MLRASFFLGPPIRFKGISPLTLRLCRTSKRPLSYQNILLSAYSTQPQNEEHTASRSAAVAARQAARWTAPVVRKKDISFRFTDSTPGRLSIQFFIFGVTPRGRKGTSDASGSTLDPRRGTYLKEHTPSNQERIMMSICIYTKVRWGPSCHLCHFSINLFRSSIPNLTPHFLCVSEIRVDV
jgi:hypothetical protein